MLDLRFICDNREKVETAMRNRGMDISLDELISMDESRRKGLTEVEELKSRKNKTSETIAVLKKEKKDSRELIGEMQEVSDRIKMMDAEIRKVEEKIKELLMAFPNLPDDSVPVGKDYEDNQIIREDISNLKTFNFHPREHSEIGELLDIIDIPTGVKIAESRFVLIKGRGAQLERALIRFMLEQHIKNGYLEIIPPLLVNAKTMTGTGQLPKFEEELYKCKDDELYLIPTAEVPLTNIHSGQILQEAQLPIKYVAYTPCFRRESGSYGKDTKGLIRNHQFNKVEIVKLARPQDSFKELESLLADAESILQLLKLPYRVVSLCTGDVGFSAAKTYDIEMWMPGEKKWREVSSCSNFTDFQARRINIKYRDKGNSVSLVHTLNGSGLAVGRTFAAILENYQNEDGTVGVPDLLRPYMDGLICIK